VTFLATVNGALVPGGSGPWEKPWAFRCDTCGDVRPYGVVASRGEKLGRLQVRHLNHDQHRCYSCETPQLDMGLGA
jgi:hypothetical protein